REREPEPEQWLLSSTRPLLMILRMESAMSARLGRRILPVRLISLTKLLRVGLNPNQQPDCVYVCREELREPRSCLTKRERERERERILNASCLKPRECQVGQVLDSCSGCKMRARVRETLRILILLILHQLVWTVGKSEKGK